MTQTTWEEEFEQRFHMGFFATENYTGGADEFEFTRWSDTQSKLALAHQLDIKNFISKTISQEKEKVIEEFRKKLTNAEMTIVFSSTTGNDTTQKVPMYQSQQIEELINLLQNK